MIENIKEAVTNLYGTYDYIEKEAQAFIEDVLKDKKYIQIYNDIAKDEKLNNKIVHESKNIISNTKSINVVLLEPKNYNNQKTKKNKKQENKNKKNKKNVIKEDNNNNYNKVPYYTNLNYQEPKKKKSKG